MTTTHPMQRTFDELRRSRRDDPDTSKDAARRAHGLAGEHARLILDVLRARRARCKPPLTPHEIASLCGLGSVQVSRRLAELEANGLIVVAGIGTTPSGRTARTWQLAGVPRG